MGFPGNWGQAASLRLTAMARGTVQHAVDHAEDWTTPLPGLPATLRYSAGYDAATAGRMAPADTDGRCILLTCPHFEIQVAPGERWRPTGATFYRVRPAEAARILKREWGSVIFTELSPEAAHAVAEEILGCAGDRQAPAAGSNRAV